MSGLVRMAAAVRGKAGPGPGGPPFGDTLFTTQDIGDGTGHLYEHTASGPLGGHTYTYADGEDPNPELDQTSMRLVSNTVDRGFALSKPSTAAIARGVWYASEVLPTDQPVYCDFNLRIATSTVGFGVCLGYDPNEPFVGPAIGIRPVNNDQVRLARDWTITAGGAGQMAANIGDRLRLIWDPTDSYGRMENITQGLNGQLLVLNPPTNPNRFGIYSAERFTRNDFFIRLEWGVV